MVKQQMNEIRIYQGAFTSRVLGPALFMSFLEILFSGCRRSNGITVSETNKISA